MLTIAPLPCLRIIGNRAFDRAKDGGQPDVEGMTPDVVGDFGRARHYQLPGRAAGIPKALL